MATHTQTGRACEEHCIPNDYVLTDDKKAEGVTMLNEKKEKKKQKWNEQNTS